MTAKLRRTKRRNVTMIAGYGFGDFGLNIYWNALSIWLVFWYINIIGISPNAAGFVFLVCAVWDAISDPVVATLSERVQTRHGTYRPFLLYASPVLGLSFVLLFWAPPLDGGLLIAVLLLIGMFARTAYTLVAIPYAALTSRITYDSLERTELTGVRMFFAFAGLLVVSLVFPPLARWLSGGPDMSGAGFQGAVFLGAVVATIALWICFLATKERPPPIARDAKPRRRLAWSPRLFARNEALHALLLIVFCQSGANAALFISMVFFIDINAGSFAQKEIVLTTFAAATMAGVAVWTLVIRQLGRKRAWALVSILVALAGLHMLVFGPALFSGVPLQIIAIGFSFSAFAVLIWSFVPDTVEYGQIRSGQRLEGMVFGSVLVVQKLSSGVMGVVVTQVLVAIGYDAKSSVHSALTADGLVIFLSCAPAGLLLLSMIPVSLFPMNRRTHADIVEKLEQGEQARP